MGSLVRWCALVVALAVGALGGTARADTIGTTVIIGGPGGSTFSEGCGDDGYLVGMAWEGMKDINWIEPICQRFENGRGVGEPVSKARYGQPPDVSFGSDNTLFCPPDTAVETIGVGVSNVNLVHKFSFACRNPDAHAYTNTAWAGPIQGATKFVQPAGCGGGAIAVGVIGRYGALIDGLGLMCKVIAAPAPPRYKPVKSLRPRPSAAAPSPPAPPPPQATATDDVDMYSEPNGDSTNLGVWTKGSHATPLGKQDGWCKLKGINNGQDAWVWGEFVSGCV